MSDYLPPLVIEEILCRLPTKCLLKCRTVCKSWYNLIKTPRFISTHLTTSTEDTDKLLLISTISGNIEKHTIHFNNENMDEYLPLRFPLKSFEYRDRSKSRPLWGYPRVIDSHNGLVCLYDKFCTTVDWRINPQKCGEQFILWNPCIGKYLLVPPPSIDSHRDLIDDHATLLGFGFDDRCNDFKIFKMVFCLCENRCEKPALVECEVYSLNAGLWRNVTGDLPYYEYVLDDAYHAYVEGALHWPVDDGTKNLLMVLDVRDEVFSEISLPESLIRVRVHRLCVYKCESSLAIVEEQAINPEPRFLDDEDNQYVYQIWLMKEYGKVESWMQLWVLNGSEIGITISRVLEFRNSKQVFVEPAEEEHLVCVDREAQKVLYVTPSEDLGYASVRAYTEGLALLDKGVNFPAD